jgi:exodeoxyribonuclease V alpha subunit
VLEKFPSVRLLNIYRQGEGSSIVKNGHRILNGMMPFPDDEFRVIWTGDLIPNDPVTHLLKLVKESGIDFGSLNNQIATPINKTWVGQTALNQKIQSLIMGDRMFEAYVMPRKRWKQDETLMLCRGDKIIWSVNDYHLEIYNGETGIVEDIINDVININFGDRTIGVPPWIEYLDPYGETKGYDPREQIDLAYALTTHKTQGSEYENIVYILNKSAYGMLYRNNFYTAITRARKRAFVITDQRSIRNAVSNKVPPINAFKSQGKKK